MLSLLGRYPPASRTTVLVLQQAPLSNKYDFSILFKIIIFSVAPTKPQQDAPAPKVSSQMAQFKKGTGGRLVNLELFSFFFVELHFLEML